MKVLGRTPRTDLAQDSITYNVIPVFEDLKAAGWNEDALNRHLIRLARLSTRVVFDKGEVDFDLLSPFDNEAELKRKIDAYLNSEKVGTIDDAFALLLRHDRPASEEQVPTREGDSPN